MRLIDADEKMVAKLNDFETESVVEKEMTVDDYLSLSDYDAPTIDAVSVVRCKDCKCWTEWANGTGSCSRFALDWIGTDADDFCSMGERKGDE